MSIDNNEQAVSADISPLKGLSGLWFIPLVTVLVGLWMVYDNWANQGPLITIEFTRADGLEEAKTKIRIRNVEVGRVEKIELNEMLDGVVVTVRMSNDVKDLLVEGTQFWVVQPRIGLSEVSGLGTLLSGQYIEFSPGHSDERISHFEGLDKPPLTPLGTPGLHITLNTEDEFSYSEGDPIHYQGFTVGKIEDVYFNPSERAIYYNAFIEAPHHELITTNTRFWNSTGIRAELTKDGVSLQTGPIETIIQGGISFSVPDGEPLGDQVTERAYFYIYPSHSAIHEKKYVFSLTYVVMVEGSVGGLSAGAPVLYRGLPIGKVLRIDYLPEGRNLLDREMKIPLFIEVNPGRLGLPDTKEGLKQAQEDINHWIKQGLTATIKSQNFLLEQQLVELTYEEYEEALAETALDFFNGVPVIPGGKDSISKMTDSIEGILAKVNGLPIESIGDSVDTLLKEGTATLASIEQLAQSSEAVMADVKAQQLVKTLNESLAEIDNLAQSFSNGSETNADIQRLLESVSEAFIELKPLLTELKNKPNGLIFTGGTDREPEPMRKKH